MYKNFFNNSVGFNTLEVKLDTGITLYFQLDDNPVQHIWQDICVRNKQSPIVSSFNNKSVDQYLNLINSVLERLDQPLLDFPINSDQLNDLHSRFVRQKTNTEDWDLINVLIHRIEGARKNEIDLNYYLNFELETNEIAPLEEHHKLWLTTNFDKWGTLSLGYQTLGKNWLDVAIDQDDPSEVNVKNHIGTETIMAFGIEPLSTKRGEQQFWSYAKDRNINIDLNKLSLGNYLLGKIIITDDMLKYHNQVSDWYVPNHVCKLMWNKDVLSKANSITSIQFYNSDIAHTVNIEHTKISCLK